ncbi:MAG: 23S rRNA (pseudouridine(1915)-N(3))-methyltransferase RlmH [Galactobacter sp.]
MSIRVLAVGKKHETWVSEGIERYSKRLKKPWDLSFQLIPHSSRQEDAARTEESGRLLAKIKDSEYVVLLDERGKMLSSPGLAKNLRGQLDRGAHVTVVIGGAYGVDTSVHQRANLIWSLSDLVFPHQLVRLMLVEQVYRAQEIAAGGSYHHV